MDYDETGTDILIDTKYNGEDRKLVVRAARNGFTYSFIGSAASSSRQRNT